MRLRAKGCWWCGQRRIAGSSVGEGKTAALGGVRGALGRGIAGQALEEGGTGRKVRLLTQNGVTRVSS
jgi:hypothetical protein